MDNEVHSFRDLRIWSQGIEIVKEIYSFTNRFPDKERFGLASQMQRAAVSVPSNIAEGHIRSTTKEFIKYLYIALGSLAELETQAIIARELGYSPGDDMNKFIMNLGSESRQIRTLLIKLEKTNP